MNVCSFCESNFPHLIESEEKRERERRRKKERERGREVETRKGDLPGYTLLRLQLRKGREEVRFKVAWQERKKKSSKTKVVFW